MKIKIFIFLIICLVFTSCHKKPKKVQITKYPVTTAIAKQKDAPIYIENIGHVQAFIKVDIRSRVEGELQKVNFDAGSEVTQGELLFEIDPKDYEAELQKTKATLSENSANLNFAKDKLMRNKPLYKEDYISELYFENLITDVKKYEAIINQNKADVKKATINLNYCYIYSPINGKIGIINIDQGNLISQDSEHHITTITQTKPIYVLFSVPQSQLPQIKNYQNQNPLKVISSFDDFETQIEGELKIIDNEIDEKSANIKLKALYTNEDNMLTPGQFVTTRLILKVQKDAIIIPYQAIQITTLGNMVFVVKNNKVEMRKVKLGNRLDGKIIILNGISKDEKVVIQGQINLIDGSYVFETKE